MRTQTILLLCLLGVICLFAGSAAAFYYAINDSGEVVGTVSPNYGDARAFLWLPEPAYGLPAGMNDLGTFGSEKNWAADINNSGQVVGAVYYPHFGYLWEEGVITDLGTLGGDGCSPRGMNDVAQVVGSSHTASGDSHPFLWESGAMTDLGFVPVGSTGSALAINNLGQVVGTWRDPSIPMSRPFLWENGVVVNLELQLDARHASAWDINDSGQVVGGASGDGWWRAVLWEGDVLTELSPPPGYPHTSAYAINNSGQVVGTGSSGWATRAVLWEDGVAYDLNDLIPPNTGWLLTTAEDINDAGQIVGTMRLADESTPYVHAFIWEDGMLTDLGPTHYWIPEPATLWLVALGALGLLLRRRAQQ